MASENNGETHGYVWPDGTLRTAAYEPGVRAIVKNDNDGVRLADKPYEGLRVVPKDLPVPSQQQLAKAYAEWVKDMTRWRKAMDEWEKKYG